MDYLPQPYPLWCAELDPDGGVRCGRVVAWIGVDARMRSEADVIPLVAWDAGTTTPARLAPVRTFFGTSDADAKGLAGKAARNG